MTLSRSPGVVLLKGLFLTKQVILLRTLFPTTRAWGAPLPYTPSGDGGARGLRPSRALPGLFWWRFWFPTKRAILLWTLFPTTRAWGAPLPYTPLGDGVREGATLSRSPGAVLVEILVSDETGYSFVDVVSDRAGVGRSAPLHPLG